MRAAAKPRRRIWPWILGGILAISATIILTSILNGTWGAGSPTNEPTREPTPSATAFDPTPTGCLGGPSRDVDMLLAAEGSAPHDLGGAIEFSASFVRWIQRYPYPSSDEAEEVQGAALASESFTEDLAEYFRGRPDLSGGIVPEGTDYHMSTLPGVWHVETSEPDEVAVSIGSGYVVDGVLSTTLRSSITVTVAWQGDGWKVISADGLRTPADLYEVGTDFTGGC